MLTIHPIPAFNDNYIWAIINNDTKQAIIVDAGDAAQSAVQRARRVGGGRAGPHRWTAPPA